MLPISNRTIAKATLAAASMLVLTTASFAQSDAQLTAAAQDALHAQMGDAAKDLTVHISGGNASLSGWAYAPKDVREATYILSKVPGIAHAYGAAVQTWTSTDHYL